MNNAKVFYQRGITLIEVLTAMVVLSVGMAGLASLAMSSMRSAADGEFNSQATILAEELADTMRANITAYEVASFADTPADAEKNCYSGVTCSATEMAEFDAQLWAAHTAAVLPGGLATMCMDSTPNDGQPGADACDGNGLNTIKLYWLDNRSADALGQGESYHRHVVSFIP